MKSYYAVLELPDFSDVKSIVASYRQLAMKWHPDRNKSRDASQIFIEIQTAYEILRNDEQRKYYDAWLREVKKDNMGYSPQTDNIFQDTKMARQAREYAYKYADMSFDDFATKAKIKTKQAAGTLLKWVAGFTVAFALVTIVPFLARQYISDFIGKENNSKTDTEEQLIKELKADLDELNNGLPKFLDSDTRLDKISLSGKVVVSTHTYTRYSYSEVDPVYLRQTVEKNAKQQLCTNSKDFILFGYSYRYDYFGKYNQKITSVYFNKDTCGY